LKSSDFEFEQRSDNFKNIIRKDVFSGDDIQSNTVRALYAWWKKYHPELPKRSDFDIAEHWKIAPHIHLLQMIKPGHYLYRLNGEKVVEMIGSSRRGHTITIENPLPEDRHFAQYLDDIIAQKIPRRCIGSLSLFDKSYSQFESVDCPLRNEAGDVEFVIGAIISLDKQDTALA
jgi:hypothetical protein